MGITVSQRSMQLCHKYETDNRSFSGKKVANAEIGRRGEMTPCMTKYCGEALIRKGMVVGNPW